MHDAVVELSWSCHKNNSRGPPTSFVSLFRHASNLELFPIYNLAIFRVKSYIYTFHRVCANKTFSVARVTGPTCASTPLTANLVHALPERELHEKQPASHRPVMAPKYSLSDSESEAEADAATVPSDAVLEQALRDEVAVIFKSGNMEELTVKRVRLAAEKKLGLEEGFFKTKGDWKTRSDQIIKDEVVRPQAVAIAR